MITVLGGSFTRFHKGHMLMLDAAIRTGNHLIVGLASDDFLKSHKAYDAPRYSVRKRALDDYISRFTSDYEIYPLDSRNGNADASAEYDTIVVSRETRAQAEAINSSRIRKGLKPLRIVEVPIALAEDLFPISSSRIVKGEIRANGRRVTPVLIGISTANSLKVMALDRYISKVMRNYEIFRNQEYELETDQPLGIDTQISAMKRAQSALGSRDYGVGVESGVYMDRITGSAIDIHYCVVIDRYSRVTVGTGSGFAIPPDIVRGIRNGLTESQAFVESYGGTDPGSTSGIAGIISGNRITRQELVYEAIRNAFIPRTGASFYGLDEKIQ